MANFVFAKLEYPLYVEGIELYATNHDLKHSLRETSWHDSLGLVKCDLINALPRHEYTQLHLEQHSFAFKYICVTLTFPLQPANTIQCSQEIQTR